MNKKVMALAVAGAFAAPALVHAQASNVQIYGTAYIEYGYAKQGVGAVGQLNNVDLLQTPGSNIGFKGEEALGGGLTAWFQCESSLDFRGAGSQNPATTALTQTTQNSGILCGRNSALGMKGSFGNIFAGNWDTPWKQYSPNIIGTNETGFLGTAPMLYGNSTSTNDGDNGVVFERRQGNQIQYISPNISGFSGAIAVSTPQRSTGISSNATVGKPRMFSLGLNYTNGPLYIAGAWETHSNFGTLNGLPSAVPTISTAGVVTAAGVGVNAGGTQKGTTDTGWMIGAAYQFGPVKAGAVYAKRQWDSGCNVNTPAPAVPTCLSGDGSVSTYGLNLDWAIMGPHQLKAAYIKANSTSGGFGTAAGTAVGNLTFNGGAGSTGGSMWEIEYLYNFSKRTRVSFGYATINNDANARYSLSGFTAVAPGQNSSVFGVSMKNTF
jgi:predicted porin